MQPKRNIAARAGRWSARHRKAALIGWVLFVIVAFVGGGAMGKNTLVQGENGVGESGRADRIVKDAYPDEVGEMVLLQSRTAQVDSPGFRAAVDDLTKRLDGVAGVREIESPYGVDGTVSDDRRSALLTFEIPGDPVEDTKVADQVDASVAAVDAVARAHPDLRIEQSGGGSSEEEFMEVFNSDLQTATTTSLPLTLIILLVAFGALVAAGVPLLLGITAIVATMGLVAPLSQLAPVDDGVDHVIVLIGLAVGVDYALFYLRRFREERDAGRDDAAALEAAAATSGRSVLISGITVMTAMAGMYFGGAATFQSFATGTIAVVGVAMIGSLTVLPAMLSLLGGRIEKGRIPGLGRLKRRATSFGLWSRVVDRVMLRPKLWASLSVAFLVALSIPAVGMQTGTPGVDTLPEGLAVVEKFEHLRDAFPSETTSLQVVVKAPDTTAGAVQAGIDRLERATAQHRDLFPDAGSFEQNVNPDKTVNVVSLGVAGDGQDDESVRALETLRTELIPPTLGTVGGVETAVTGGAAMDHDFNSSMKSHLPLVFGFVIVAAFLLLLVTFRSIVVPLKAIALNLLSVGAAYGAMTLVFNHGWLGSLLGFSGTTVIESWIPLFMFVVLFGLSMDYHVFILSRVRELVDRGMRTEDAVASAIKSTAGVVTSAALVMVAVFAVFGMLSWMMFKQMGVGLAFAVLLDATLIRGVLLPASMKLLGEWNWWLPKRLEWLPKVAPHGEAVPAKA